MMRKAVWLLISVLWLVGCGTGTQRRLLTRPEIYEKMVEFGRDGHPVNLDELVRTYPELRGRVLTAPEWIEEYEQLLRKARADQKPIVEFRMPPGTHFTIEVLDAPELKRTYIVPPDGYIDFWRIGKVHIANRTRDEIKADIEERLRKFYRDPHVTIQIESAPTAYRSGQGGIPILTAGGVSSGDIVVMGNAGGFFGNQAYTGRETLVTVLGQTRLAPTAEWRAIRVIRRNNADPLRKGRVIFCDLWNYFVLGDVRQDIPLFPGDVVFVPQKWWTGEQLEKDWDLMLKYIGGIFTLDRFRDGLRSKGELRD